MKIKVRSAGGNDTFKSPGSKRGSRRSIFIARALLVLMFFSTLLPAPELIVPNRVMAAPGDLVPSFGTGGFVLTDFAGGNDTANAVAATFDGRIIAAGSATIPGKGTDFALARYDENGNLDPSFGQGGKATADFFGANDGIRGIAFQLDDKIVVSGFATNGTKRVFAIARYLENGNLDSTFDQDGKVTFDLGSTSEAFKVAVQADGKIVAVGDSRPQNSLDFTLVRLNPTDGSLDNSFGNNGVARVDFGFTDRAIDLAITEEDIFAIGIVVKSQTDSDFGVARLTLSNGSLDSAFDGDGKLTVDFFGKQDGAQAIVIKEPLAGRPGPDIVVGGFATTQTLDIAIASIKADGSLDPNFDGDGKQTIDFSGGNDQGFALFEQPDGDIVAAGWNNVGTSFDAGIVRVNPNGSPDTTFGQQGQVTTNLLPGANNVAFDAMLYIDRIITVGVTDNPNSGSSDFAVTAQENKKFVEFKKRGPSNPVVQGDIITYTFEITNLTDKEIGFQVQDSLSFLDVTFVKDQNTGWDLAPQGRITRNIVVPSGQTSLFALRVRANRAGTIENNATLLQFASYTLYKGTEYSFVSSDRVETEVIEFAITEATRNGKDLNVKTNGLPEDSSGTNQSSAIAPNAIEPQAKCPVVLYDGVEQKTKLDPDNPTTTLIVKKGYKKLAPGQTVRIRVRLCGGIETDDFIYTRPQ